MSDTWAELLHPSYRRRFAGRAGTWYHQRGLIECLRAPYKGVDENLFGILKVVADTLALQLVISSVDTNRHATHSRHYVGLAVDLWQIGPVDGRLQIASPRNPEAVAVVEFLLARGFEPAEGRTNPGPAVLLGPPRTRYNRSPADHDDHLHLSLGRK